MRKRMKPRRGDGNLRLKQVLFLELDLMLFQKRPELVLETLLPVVFPLVPNVVLDRLDIGVTHGEGTVTDLPPEVANVWKLAVNPTGRTGFQFPQHIFQRRLLSQRHEKVDVIFNAADLNRNATEVTHDSAE